MSQKTTFLSTTLGKKTLMAVTGILLIGFLIAHLAGNFLLFDSIGGREMYNDYSHWLITHPLIIPMEIGLVALFLIHIFTAIKVSRLSQAARPQKYALRRTHGKSTFASRTMLQTGSLIFAFLVFHLATFKFGEEHPVMVKDVAGSNENISETTKAEVKTLHTKRDIYKTVVDNFAKKWYSILYIISMIILGIHLWHGIQSAFQTLGLNHPRYNCCIKKVSSVLAILFAVGYSIFPIYFGFINPVTGG